VFQLESWIHSVITGNWERDASFRIYAGRIASGPPTRMRIETYRDFNLCRTLQYAYAKSEFYRNKFNDCGLKPEHIGGYNDLHRFPLTEPSDLSRTPRHFLCTSQSKIARPRIFVTSGTTGPQKEIYWSSWDIEHITDTNGCHFERYGPDSPA
jgi:phenylacetate-coenzyme A ligase PaaK-like adenylate-forming protein